MSATTQPCPVCGEQILATAKKCRFCDEWVDEAARAAGGPVAPPRVEGRLLIVPKGARLPGDVCGMCGSTESVGTWAKTFRYVPPWAYLLGRIGARLAQRDAALELPECEPCRKRRVEANWIAAGIIIGGGVALLGGGFFIGHLADPRDGGPAGLAVAFIPCLVLFAAVMLAYLPRSRPKCKLIDGDGNVTLKYPEPNGLFALLGDGEAAGAASGRRAHG
jgi:hypothetical protein